MQLQDSALFRQQCFINGTWQDATSGKTVEVTNPANGEILGTIPFMGKGETHSAIAGAAAALQEWQALTARERSAAVRRWNDLMLANIDDLAMIMTLEQGKPLAEARGEIIYAASFLEWFAEEARRIYGDVIPPHQADKRIIVIKQPIGVVGAITPWNFPSSMITRKAGPALAAGCSFVCKPATATPYSALALAELADRAGIPAGVFNIITGSAREIGAELTANAVVKKITFTGSTEVGKKLLVQAAATVKKCSMELGGNAPFIVFDDANVDAAVAGTMASKFRNTGQTCVCTNRIYAQAGIYEEFLQKLTAAVKQLKVADGTEEGATQGPLIDSGALSKVEEHVADAVQHHARVLIGGERHALGGNFYQPTILADVTQDMLVAHEETFGPLAPVIRFETEEEVIAMANDTEFGLASYFYARDFSRIWRVAEAIEAGMVGINTGIMSTTEAPFGGVKQSGLGREGSKYGIEEYVEVKYLCIGGI